MNALVAREKFFKIVGCVKIAITFSFVRNASIIGLNSKVYTQIHIKNTMFLVKFSDVCNLIYPLTEKYISNILSSNISQQTKWKIMLVIFFNGKVNSHNLRKWKS